MPYRSLSLEEFADFIGQDVRYVEKLALNNELPAQKVAGQWRFNKVQVVEWLQQSIPNLDIAHLKTLEKALGSVTVDRDPTLENQHLVLTELMGVAGINLDLNGSTKSSCLREMVALGESTGILYDTATMLEALEQREQMCSTGMPDGVAIPHPRHPQPYAMAEPFVCLGRSGRGIPFGAPDGKMTHLIFLVCCQDESHHLHVLARLARLLTPANIEILMDVEDATEALECLLKAEKELAPH